VSENSTEKPRFQISQIGAGVWIAIVLAWIIFSDASLAWTLLLAPSIVACMWPLMRHENLTAWAERREGQLQTASVRAEAKTGKVAKYFSTPLFRGCLWIWQKTEPIADCHVRAGLRAGAILYFGAAMVFFAVLVGYVIVGIVVAIALLGFFLWLAGRVLSSEPLVGRGGDDEDTGGTSSPVVVRRPAQSRPGLDFLGNPKTDVLDSSGRKIAEVRPTTDFLGNPKEEIYNTSGEKIGERRPTSDFLGNPQTDELNSEGEKVGESHPGTDWLGEPVEEHFDNSGKRIGESRPDTDFLGDPVVRHKWKKDD